MTWWADAFHAVFSSLFEGVKHGVCLGEEDTRATTLDGTAEFMILNYSEKEQFMVNTETMYCAFMQFCECAKSRSPIV